ARLAAPAAPARPVVLRLCLPAPARLAGVPARLRSRRAGHGAGRAALHPGRFRRLGAAPAAGADLQSRQHAPPRRWLAAPAPAGLPGPRAGPAAFSLGGALGPRRVAGLCGGGGAAAGAALALAAGAPERRVQAGRVACRVSSSTRTLVFDSSYSACQSESRTMPPPPQQLARPPRISRVRMQIELSISPRQSTYSSEPQ